MESQVSATFLAVYQKKTSLPFEAIRTQAWKDSILAVSNKEETK